VLLFLVTSHDAKPFGPFLRTWGARIQSKIRFLRYEELFNSDSMPGAETYVFTDLEQLTAESLRMAAQVADQLVTAETAPTILNHPAKVMLRYELARTLHERGINPFQAYRVLLTRTPDRFPVFLRFEHEHDGPASPLLWSQRELDQKLLRAYVRGYDLSSLLMVEFQDTSDERGIFRRYTVYVIGDELIVGNLAFAPDWVVKYSGEFTEEQLAEQRAALSSQAHDAVLSEIAQLAGVGWGRFDYALVDGRVCIWELNTNPTLLLTPDEYPPEVRIRRAELAERLTEAIGRLAGDDVSELRPLRIKRPREPSLVAPARTLPRRARAALRRLEPLALLMPRPVLWLVRRAAYRRSALEGSWSWSQLSPPPE
jgi:hypothetical protein